MLVLHSAVEYQSNSKMPMYNYLEAFNMCCYLTREMAFTDVLKVLLSLLQIRKSVCNMNGRHMYSQISFRKEEGQEE